MSYSLQHIARILGHSGEVIEYSIEHLLLDSRRIYSPQGSLFFALKGDRRDGHKFIPEVYRKGVRSFVVSSPQDQSQFPDAGFILVPDTLLALQQLAAHHRAQFDLPVVGITGSNGKTIVKEWLYQLLHDDYQVVRSPRSYNSQIGVPLSVWQLNSDHNLAVFEAGISRPGEMEKLATIIRPTLGVLTNIGEAHSEGFTSNNQKTTEKLKLFQHCEAVIYPKDSLPPEFDFESYKNNKAGPETKYFDWSRKGPAWLSVTGISNTPSGLKIFAEHEGKKSSIEIPFSDNASVENAITCWAILLVMGLSPGVINQRMSRLQPVNMRLELKKGINQCSIINDSYSADLNSLEIALSFLQHHGGTGKKTVILSDLLQTGIESHDLYDRIVESLKKHKVVKLLGIGPTISNALQTVVDSPGGSLQVELFKSTEEFIRQFRSSQFRDQTILIKGARIFEFEKIVQLFEHKVHQTVLEINLNAIAHNLNFFQGRLQKSTKVMAMVKAFAYGSGGAEIAGILQFHKVDYLGVAYADEGVDLRRAGITLPIMVMNPEVSAFGSLTEYNLEPDIYSFELLHAFDRFLQDEGLSHFPVHIEIETGMNRLGFNIGEIAQLGKTLKATASMRVQSVFSHLASSEDPKEDAFTMGQLQLFKNATNMLRESLQYSFIEHIANSGAILRLPDLQLDMVRLGIGLYGVDMEGSLQSQLETVATLRSTIAQIKHLSAGDTVSYNRHGVIKKDSTIATVRIGYADGFSRKLGKGIGKIWVRDNKGMGHLAPVIGSVCMDMTMIDITGIPGVSEGDEVIVFGRELPIQQVALWADTIPYEIMTSVSQRVKRVYFEE